MAEHDEQVAVVKWFRLQYPKFKGCFFSIPNGSFLAGKPYQRANQMKKLKKEGFKNGVSDLFLAVPKNGYSGLWVEMKDKGKTKCDVSKEQQEHLDLMREMGYGAVWCAGADAAISQIKGYMGD